MLLMDGMFWSNVKSGFYFTRRNLGKRRNYKETTNAINYGLINVIFSWLRVCIDKIASHRNYVAARLFFNSFLIILSKSRKEDSLQRVQSVINYGLMHTTCRYCCVNRDDKIPKGITLLSDSSTFYMKVCFSKHATRKIQFKPSTRL